MRDPAAPFAADKSTVPEYGTSSVQVSTPFEESVGARPTGSIGGARMAGVVFNVLSLTLAVSRSTLCRRTGVWVRIVLCVQCKQTLINPLSWRLGYVPRWTRVDTTRKAELNFRSRFLQD